MLALSEHATNGFNGIFFLQEKTDPESSLRRISVVDKKNSICVFETVLQDYNINRNKRKYSKMLLESALSADPIKEKLKNKNFFGEANHPFDENVKRQISVDQTRISHIVTEIDTKSEPNLILGVVETAVTQPGIDMYNLITKNKCNMAFSMRGMGKVNTNLQGIAEVTNPFIIIGYDWVTYPSHAPAYMKKVIAVNENAENNSLYNEIRTNDQSMSEVSKSEFVDFVSQFSNTYKRCTDFFDMSKAEMFVEDGSYIIMEQDLLSICVMLEKNVKKETSKIFSRLNKNR